MQTIVILYFRKTDRLVVEDEHTLGLVVERKLLQQARLFINTMRVPTSLVKEPVVTIEASFKDAKNTYFKYIE